MSGQMFSTHQTGAVITRGQGRAALRETEHGLSDAGEWVCHSGAKMQPHSPTGTLVAGGRAGAPPPPSPEKGMHASRLPFVLGKQVRLSAPVAVLMLGGMAGPFDILLQQHRELEELLERLASEPDAEEVTSGQEALARLLRLHSRMEERCIHPLVTRVEGRARAREEAEDHLTLRELMEELQELTPRGVDWQARLFTLTDLVVAHVQATEHGVLPRLSASLDSNEMEELGHDLALTYEELLERSQHPPASSRGAVLEPLHWDA